MQATSRNHADIETLRGIGNTVRLLAAQLLLVGIVVGALVGIHGGTAFAHTGEQSQPPNEIVSEQCHFLIFPYCFPPSE